MLPQFSNRKPACGRHAISPATALGRGCRFIHRPYGFCPRKIHRGRSPRRTNRGQAELRISEIGTGLRDAERCDIHWLPQVPLHIYGSGPEAEKIVAMKETDHQLPSVQLHGQKSQAECQEALAQFQFLVMASRLYEGFPRVIVEAYSCGRPVVVPRLGGMAAAVEEGVTGLLFRPGDANDLADKVRWLTAHPDEIARMGENALNAYHARYSPEVNRDQLLAIYERAMTYSKGQPFIRSVTVPS